MSHFSSLSGPVQGGVLMAVSACCFAGVAAIGRYLSDTLPPLEIAFFRNFFGLIFILPWVLKAGLASLKTRRLGMHGLRATVGLTAMSCWFIGISLVPLAEASALGFTGPLFGTLGAALFLREKVRMRRWMAVAVGFVGALIVIRPGLDVIQPGSLIILTGAFFMACAALTVKSLSRTESPATIVFYMGFLMTPMSLAIALPGWVSPPQETWVWLVVVGLAATLGQLAMAASLRATDASIAMPFKFTNLLMASLLGYLVFAEVPDIWTWAGAAVIFVSTVYIARREAKASQQKPPITPV